MSGAAGTDTTETVEPKRQAIPIGVRIAIGLFASVVLISIFAPLLPFDPYKQDLMTMLSPPSAAHPFGVDLVGRDVLARVVWGGRPPLLVGVLAVIAALIIGVAAGLWAGYRRGKVDAFLSRLADIQMSIPGLVLALLVLVILGPSIINLVIVIALESWPLHFRVVRSHVMAVRSLAYVEVARLAGMKEISIILRHIVPGTLPLLAVTATANFSHAVLAEAGLSFLGIGVQPPTPDWGMMVSEGQSQLGAAWWISIFPGLALSIVLLCAQIIGDWLSDRFSVRGGAEL
jgi:peptide/nickel transport system permease protein